MKEFNRGNANSRTEVRSGGEKMFERESLIDVIKKTIKIHHKLNPLYFIHHCALALNK